MKVFIFNVIHSMDGENALPKDIKLRAYSIEYWTSRRYILCKPNYMKIYVYIMNIPAVLSQIPLDFLQN